MNFHFVGTCCVDTQSLIGFNVLGFLAFMPSSLSSAIRVGSQRSEFKHVQLCFGFDIQLLVVFVFRNLLHRPIEYFMGWTLHSLAIWGNYLWFSHGFPMQSLREQATFSHLGSIDSGLPDFRVACFQCLGASRFQIFIASKCIRNNVKAAMDV